MNKQDVDRPVALLVEDKPELLRAKQNLFNISGFQAICVRTAAEALREFIATPAVDIIIADINLNSSDNDDISGVNVATAIREMRPEVPIVAVSGRLDSLSDTQRAPFSDELVKGTTLKLNDYHTKIEQWHGAAIEYRERRTTSSRRAIEALEAGTIRHAAIDYDVLREFIPGRQLTSEATSRVGTVISPDDVLRDAGWWLQLIQAGRSVSGEVFDKTRTRLALLVWLREESNYLAVLHGFSFLSARGAAATDAVEQLLRLMAAYWSGQMPKATDVSETEHQRLMTHLEAVFGVAYSR